MGKGVALSGREQTMMRELTEALGASLNLRQVLNDAYRLLLPLVGADHGALAVSRDRAENYEWIVQTLPPAFLGSYAEMAPHDFVRASVIASPNVVMRDSEMVDRRTLERNMMYVRAREVGAPLEHVMAVMLHVDGGWQSGLSLYRERRRRFSDRDRVLLQQLTPAIANAVRNCRSFGAASRWETVLEAMLGHQGRAVILVQPPAKELDRTAGATVLLEKWFTSEERRAGALPASVMEELTKARTEHALGRKALWYWQRDGDTADLEVKMIPLPKQGDLPVWALMLREVPHLLPIPAWFHQKRLTRREVEIAFAALQGWDDHLIADHVKCAPTTVKKHLQHVFDKLGISNRKQLIHLALRTQ